MIISCLLFDDPAEGNLVQARVQHSCCYLLQNTTWCMAMVTLEGVTFRISTPAAAGLVQRESRSLLGFLTRRL